MTILVCPLSQVAELIEVRAPERIVSLLDPKFTFPDAGAKYSGKHLRLSFHDAHVARARYVQPSAKDIDELIGFVAGWDRSAPILIHCRAGMGRSTAAAFITACLHNPQTDEREIASALRRASPLARPNEFLVQLADAALRREGRMTRAIQENPRALSWDQVNAALTTTGESQPFEFQSKFP